MIKVMLHDFDNDFNSFETMSIYNDFCLFCFPSASVLLSLIVLVVCCLNLVFVFIRCYEIFYIVYFLFDCLFKIIEIQLNYIKELSINL